MADALQILMTDASSNQYMVGCGTVALFMVVEIIPVFFVIDKSFVFRRERDQDLKENLFSFDSAPVTCQSSDLSQSKTFVI